MKRSSLRLLLLAPVLAMGLPSCGPKPLHEKKETFIFVSANINLPYWQEAKAGFMDAARGLGVRAEFTGPESYSPEDELAAFQQAVARRPAGILVSPARADVFKAAIDSAVEQGIPVICVDSDAPDSKRILFIGTDNFRAGMESGKRMAELLRGQGRVVVITIPGQFNVDERLRGVREAFKNYPNVKIVKTLNDQGDPRIANDQVSALIDANERFDAILCLEASGGSGAAEALYRLNVIGKYRIVAMDKDPETLEWISRGAIAITIAQKPYTMSFYGLRLLDDLHHDAVHEFKTWRTAPASPLPAWIDTGTTLIQPGNVEEFKAAQATRAQPL